MYFAWYCSKQLSPWQFLLHKWRWVNCQWLLSCPSAVVTLRYKPLAHSEVSGGIAQGDAWRQLLWTIWHCGGRWGWVYGDKGVVARKVWESWINMFGNIISIFKFHFALFEIELYTSRRILWHQIVNFQLRNAKMMSLAADSQKKKSTEENFLENFNFDLNHDFYSSFKSTLIKMSMITTITLPKLKK